MQRQINMPYRTFFLFLGLSILLRLPSFWISVIDHDESTYAVIGSEIWRGGTYLYKDWVDTKPPGIFLIFASIVAVFGKSIVAIRLVGAGAIALTASFLYIAKYRLSGGQHRLAYWTGIVYIVFTALHQWSLPTNTELFFNIFTAAAWCIVPTLLPLPRSKPLFLLALCMGIGFVIKYVVLFDFVALCLVISGIWLQNHYAQTHKIPFWQFFTLGIWATLGFVLPFALCYAWFYANGLAYYFYEAAFEITRRYPSSFSIGKAAGFMGQFLLSYFPLVVGAIFTWYYAVRAKQALPYSNLLRWGLPICLFFALLAALLPGKGFAHYLLQPLLPLLFWSIDGFYYQFIVSATNIATPETTNKRMPNNYTPNSILWFIRHRYKWLWGISLVIICLNSYRFGLKPDWRGQIATYLAPQLAEHDKIYTPAATVLYFLLDKTPLTPYVHASLLINADHLQALQADAASEFRKIVAQKPRFVVLSPEKPHAVLQQYLAQSCQLKPATIGGNFLIYECR
jgi:hypothetical protein